MVINHLLNGMILRLKFPLRNRGGLGSEQTRFLLMDFGTEIREVHVFIPATAPSTKRKQI